MVRSAAVRASGAWNVELGAVESNPTACMSQLPWERVDMLSGLAVCCALC